ncbi:MAG: hypothetical protein ACI4W6_08470 [Acutalibacteraceae bacterium]
MKIKSSSEKASVRSLSLIFPVLMLIALVLRFIQGFKLIDASTGFYTQSSFITVLFYIIAFGSCLVFCVVSYMSKSSQNIEVSEIKSKPLFAVTLIFAIFMIFDGASAFFSSIEAAANTESAYLQTSLFKQLMSSGSVPDFIRSVFALFSAVYLFILAASFKTGSSAASSRKILALAPVGWTAFRMIGLFVTKISFLRVSDLLLELVMLAFMTLFFMAFAQVTSGVYSEGFSWRLPGFGLSSALIAAVLSITRLIFTLVDKDKYINPDHPFCAVDLIFFIFAVVLIFVLSKKAETLILTEETAVSSEENPDAE